MFVVIVMVIGAWSNGCFTCNNGNDGLISHDAILITRSHHSNTVVFLSVSAFHFKVFCFLVVGSLTVQVHGCRTVVMCFCYCCV